MRKLLPLAAATALLAGCATLPKADVATAEAVEAGSVPASSARLVLCEGRTETYLLYETGVDAAVWIDGKKVASLINRKVCLPIDLPPGKHVISVGYKWSPPQELALTAGQQVVWRIDEDERPEFGANMMFGALADALRQAGPSSSDAKYTITPISAPPPKHAILAPMQG